MKDGKYFSEETKAQVVALVFEKGMTIKEAAKQHNVGASTAWQWVDKHKKKQGIEFSKKDNHNPLLIKRRMGDLATHWLSQPWVQNQQGAQA